MNAFEKMKEMLETEKINSISAKAEAIIGMCGASANHYGGEICAYEKAIKIIDQVAEEMTCLSECSQCEVYDKEKHHCPRFCKVIKDSVEEIKENHYEEIRNKAIDEFVEQILLRKNILFDNGHEYINAKYVSEIAGQLKSSGNSEQLNGWIPVEERSPEKGGKYLTCDEHGNVHIFSFKNGLFYDEFLHRITNYHNRYNVPIAWRKLPEPYQKGE